MTMFLTKREQWAHIPTIFFLSLHAYPSRPPYPPLPPMLPMSHKGPGRYADAGRHVEKLADFFGVNDKDVFTLA